MYSFSDRRGLEQTFLAAIRRKFLICANDRAAHSLMLCGPLRATVVINAFIRKVVTGQFLNMKDLPLISNYFLIILESYI